MKWKMTDLDGNWVNEHKLFDSQEEGIAEAKAKFPEDWEDGFLSVVPHGLIDYWKWIEQLGSVK